MSDWGRLLQVLILNVKRMAVHVCTFYFPFALPSLSPSAQREFWTQYIGKRIQHSQHSTSNFISKRLEETCTDLEYVSFSDPNQCDSNPCQNGGTCLDEYQNYICICPIHHEGRDCEIGERLQIFSNIVVVLKLGLCCFFFLSKNILGIFGLSI